MSEYTAGERIGKVIFALAIPVGWYVFAPDYTALADRTLGSLKVKEASLYLAFLLAIAPCGYFVISLLYEAFSGRDSVWFWHPD